MKNKDQKIKELFGYFSSDYDAHMKSTNHFEVQKKLLGDLQQYLGNTVCDIACGTGAIGEILLKNRSFKLTCVDYQKKMLDNARDKFAGRKDVFFHEMDVHALHKIKEKFDTIVCSFGFYWFKDPLKVIRQLHARLQENGYCILLEENFFEGQTPQPIFARKGNDYAELARLENYLGIPKLKNLFDPTMFSLEKEVRETIDNVHELVGLVFRKRGGE